MRVYFYSASTESALISDTFENKQKNKYGSKCLKLPKSSRNEKKISSAFKIITNMSPLSISTVRARVRAGVRGGSVERLSLKRLPLLKVYP